MLSPQHHLVPAYQQRGSFDRAAGVIPVAEIYRRTGKPIYHSDQWLGKVVSGKAGRLVRGRDGRYPYFHSQESRGVYYQALLERITSFSQILGFAGCATLFDNPDVDGVHGGIKGLFDTKRNEKIAFTAHLKATNARIYERRQREFSPEEIETLTENAIQALVRATR